MPINLLAEKFVFILADAAVKAALLLTLAAVLVLCLRRASASFRHLVWALGLGGALFLPLLSCNLPHWRVFVATAPVPVQSVPALAPPVIRAAPSVAEAQKAPSSQIPSVSKAVPGASTPMPSADAPLLAPAAEPSHALPEISWPLPVLLAWLLGALFMLAQLVRGLTALQEVSRGSVLVTAGPLAEAAQAAAVSLQVTPAVEVRQAVPSGQVTVPLTYGARRPVIVLPAGADQWPLPRLQAALLHEMAHIKRRDWALQVLGQIAGAFYWFHPLVWVARTQMRAESEAACDDLVLAAGVPATEYARHLLDVALSVRDLRRLRLSAVAMAQRPKVESRLRAVLASGLSRRPVARRTVAGILVAGLLLLVPLAALRLVAQVKGVPVPAADALQLHGDFTLRYAVTLTDRTPVAAQLREYQQLRTQYAALLKQDPYFQPVPAEYYAPFSYFQERQPRTTHEILTVSSHNGQLLWRSEKGNDTYALVYDGSGTASFGNGYAGSIYPGLYFGLMQDCPFPAAGLPHIPLLKNATLAVSSGNQQTWQAEIIGIGEERARGQAAYDSGTVHALKDAGVLKLLDADSTYQKWQFLQHQKFQGLWIASHMTLTKYDTDAPLPPRGKFATLLELTDWFKTVREPVSVCEYRLLSASATPLDLSAAGMHLVSAAPHGPADPAAAQVQALDSFDVQEALHLRFHLQPWADSHRDLLQQMASGQRGAAAKVAASLAALPFPLWSGDPRPNHVWDGDPRVGHAGQPPQLEALHLAGPLSASRDFPVARSRIAEARLHVPSVVLWASGRITMTTPGIGRESSVVEQDVTPPFLADEAAALVQPAVAPAQAQSAAAHVALGQKLQQQGQPGDGIPEFRQAVQLDPSNADAQHQLANALYQIKYKSFHSPRRDTTIAVPAPSTTQDEAIQHLRKAVSLRPANADWQSTLGLYLMNRGRYLEAVSCYKTALHLLGSPPMTTSGQAASNQTANDLWNRARRVSENQASLGEALVKAGRYSKAIGHYDKALQFNWEGDYVLLGLGDALNGSGRRPEARTAWEKVLAVKPPNSYCQSQARQRLAQYPY